MNRLAQRQMAAKSPQSPSAAAMMKGKGKGKGDSSSSMNMNNEDAKKHMATGEVAGTMNMVNKFGKNLEKKAHVGAAGAVAAEANVNTYRQVEKTKTDLKDSCIFLTQDIAKLEGQCASYEDMNALLDTQVNELKTEHKKQREQQKLKLAKGNATMALKKQQL